MFHSLRGDGRPWPSSSRMSLSATVLGYIKAYMLIAMQNKIYHNSMQGMILS